MATFQRMGVWPVGYFRSYSSWLMQNRRTIASKIDTLSAEVERIGFIKVTYRADVQSDGSVQRSHDRIGLSVTKGSTLERLLMAYIANGGNPLEISSFMHPMSRNVNADGEDLDQYPDGGWVSPQTASPDQPLADGASETGMTYFPGGMLKSPFFLANGQGGRVSPGSYDYNPLVKSMHHLRAWANQDIKERLHELEARIIKQCDLREQLVYERDVILPQTWGGSVHALADADNNYFDADLHGMSLIDDISKMVFKQDEDGNTVATRQEESERGFLPFATDDDPAFSTVPLGV